MALNPHPIRRAFVRRVGVVGLAAVAVAAMTWPDQEGARGLLLVAIEGGSGTASGFALEGLGRDVLTAVGRAEPSDSEWETVFRVVAGSGDAQQPAVQGTYRVRERRVVFTPLFPFEPGVEYHVTADPVRLASMVGAEPPCGPAPAQLTYRVARVSPPPTAVVAAVYPSADSLPANLLRFYIHFSRPMRLDEAFTHVTLLDDHGSVLPDAFLRVDQELWDPPRRRLTVFLDPGRIKRGLRPRRELGGPLQAGRRYRLHVDASWPDADGVPLRAGFDKDFVTLGEDRVAPDISRFTVVTPGAGTVDPIVVTAPEPLDQAQAVRMIGVRGPDGRPVRVVARIAPGERVVRLVPPRPWREGLHQIVMDAALEDLAGNSFRRLFDVDLRDRSQRPRDDLQTVTLTVPIHVRPGS